MRRHTVTVQVYATLLWGNIGHCQAPWEVNQRGAVPPGQHPGAQVSCCHDCGFNLTDYPPLSPDLAPVDFHLFLNLKQHPAGARFTTNSAVAAAAEAYLNMQDKAFSLNMQDKAFSLNMQDRAFTRPAPQHCIDPGSNEWS